MFRFFGETEKLLWQGGNASFAYGLGIGRTVFPLFSSFMKTDIVILMNNLMGRRERVI